MNPATEDARALVGALAATGLAHVVVCAGSRSAPLAYAVYDAAQDGGLRLHVRHDERVAGFTALGIGKARGVPAAVATTSGSAVANLHPAVLEAHHAGVPLVVLAADRPPRLRGTWANQTSELQAGIFGDATRFAADLTPEQPVTAWTEAAREAAARAFGVGGARPGPVMLNVCFDDPLVPGEDEPWRPGHAIGSQADRDGRLDRAIASDADPGPEREALDALTERTRTRRTVVLAGDRAGSLAREYAARWELPLLAEPTSGSRGGPNAVAAYRLLLDHARLGGRIDHVVAFGRPTLSRPVTRLLTRPDVAVDIVQTHRDDPRPERADVGRVSAWDVAGSLADGGSGHRADPTWLPAWVVAGSAAAQAVDTVLDGWPVLTGPLVAREVAMATTAGDALVLAASNPVRDVDLAARPWAYEPAVFANRGVSGIDGTLSTAMGIVLGLGSAVSGRVLVGDVAMLHDIGALVLGPREPRPDLTVVVVNDAGGGIFSLLEPGADAERDAPSADRFERMFGTPHAVGLASVCAGLGVPHRTVASAAGLREHLGAEPRGLSVIEVRVDRADLRPLHDAIARAVWAALDAL